MDRLTIRLKNGHAGVLGHTPDWAVADRLDDYEDTGLEPEEIEAVMALAEKMNVVDLVRENLRLANKLLHTEIRLKTAGCKNAMRNFLRQPAEGGEQDGEKADL